MNKNEALKCIDSLIKDYKEASAQSKYNDLSDLNNDALTKSIKVRALNIIEAITEEGSVYRKQAYHQDGGCVSIPNLMGILEPLKADIKDDRINFSKKSNRREGNGGNGGSVNDITEKTIKKVTVGELLKLGKNITIGALALIIAGLIIYGGLLYKIGYNVAIVQSSNKSLEVSLGLLNADQLILVKEIWKYQKVSKLEKVIISRDGFILNDNKEKKVNLMELLPGNMVDQSRFERLMLSVPMFFLKHLSEVEFGNSYVVSIPKEAQEILN